MNQAIIDSDNGLLSYRPQAIIWTNDGILFIELLKTIYIQENVFENVEIAAILSRIQCYTMTVSIS